MKKQDKHPIDSFFKENINQDFPYDPALWNKADKGIAALFNKKRILYFSLLLLLFISSVAVFFAFDRNSKSGKISITKKSANSILAKENTLDKSESYPVTKSEYETKTYSKNATIATDTTLENVKEIISANRTKSILENDEKNSLSNGEEKIQTTKTSEITHDEAIDGKETESNIEPSSVQMEEESAVASNDEKQKVDYADFVLLTKPLEHFTFNAFGKGPQPSSKIKEPKKRKFATTIEFEKLNSVVLKHQLSGLSKNELDYRNKYEKVQNYTCYSLNVMLQRGGFGLVTGIGYSEAAIKTSYVISTTTFELSESKYKMIRDSIPYKNGYWSNIREYKDTISRNSEEVKLNGQASQNVFQWVHIPLKFSYQKSVYRLRFSARLGTDFMWLYNTKGTFINSSLDALNAEEKLKHFNVNASGQIMAGYQLNHKIQVGGSIYLNQQLGSNFANYNSRFQSKGYGLYVRWGL